jgi:uncharacterized membrane protein
LCDKQEKAQTSGGVRRRLPTLATAAVLAALVSGVLLLNAGSPVSYTIYNSSAINYEKAVVTAVLTESLEPAEGMPGLRLGSQTVTARLRNGPLRGQELEIINILSVTHSIFVRPGQSVIVKADRPADITPYYTIYNYDRTPGLIAVIAIFAAFMLLVGRFKGLRSMLGLGITLFFILAFLIPAIYRGMSPVLMSILTVLAVAAFSILLLNGFSRKTYTALLAVAVSVLLSALFFVVISALLQLSGYLIEEAEELILVSRATGLKIGEVLFAGVLVSSLGAVTDISISVAASMYEVREKQPGISGGELFRSGMSIGRDMIGAMSMTLILAFVGSALATLLSLAAYGSRLDQILSSDYAAIEVAHGVTGSLAVIVAVPLTAGLCVLLSGRKPLWGRKFGKAAKRPPYGRTPVRLPIDWLSSESICSETEGGKVSTQTAGGFGSRFHVSQRCLPK